MHPSLQARFGLLRDADPARAVAIAERMIAAAKEAGWEQSQIDGLLGFYGATLAPALERGDVSVDQALHQLFDYADLQGVPLDKREALLDWHASTGAFMEAHGGELPPLDRPAPAAIAAELAEIEAKMRTGEYWASDTLQHRHYDLIEQSRGPELAPAKASPAHLARVTELERSMYLPGGTPNPAYWKHGGDAELRNILSLEPPANPAGGGQASGGEAGGTSGGEAA